MNTPAFQKVESPTVPAEAATPPGESEGRPASQTFSRDPTQRPLIIIPAYNEEKNIGKVLDSLHQWVPGIPILVINDGSSDQTRDIGRDHGAEVITLPFNSGYGVALQTGFLYAVKNEFSPVIQMDADGQHDPRYICDLLREVQRDEVDVAIGSRFLGGRKYQTSLARQAGMYLFGKIASLFCKQKVSDPTSGFQALKGRAIRFAASDHFPPDYPDADFIILLTRWGFKIREIPVTMRPSPSNKSMHQGTKPVYYVLKMLLSIIVILLRKKPPE